MSHVGVNLGFGNLHENLTDEQMYLGEVATSSLELFAREVMPGVRELQG